ncbi:MPN551 family DNA-binding protein [Ureaplasma urealyticum]|uniref:YqaJ viral recombinase domain-containing protein n=1 Tax=Ureaplasma urealyticum TaxID=2130 RepID=A0ABD4SKW5_UREUR|nr:hypothetical protein [Ureaplasma urealyticum]MCF1349098.1 hypothetical protein [Ureaplasma urealyticum]
MPFIKTPNKDFELFDNQIVLSNDYKKHYQRYFAKITGSRLGAILNVGDFANPVKTWAMMVKIYNEPIDPIYAQAGVIIEPKIKDYVESVLKIKYKQYEPAQIGYDVFKDNLIFGGIPDGEPVDENGELLYPNQPMLEIKTTSIDSFAFKTIDYVLVLQKDEFNRPIVKKKGDKRAKWFNSDESQVIISEDYKLQLGLYCYLRKITKGIFAIAFLTSEDYINPQSFDINKNEIILVNYEINLNEFEKVISKAKTWYEEYIIKGISPKLSKDDLEWYKVWVNKYETNNLY